MSEYVVSSEAKSGYIVLSYKNGKLKQVKFYFRREVSDKEWERWLLMCKSSEEELKLIDLPGLRINEKESKTNSLRSEKIKLFMQVFFNYFKRKYILNTTIGEGRFLDPVPVGEDLFRVYFACNEWWADQKTIEGYSKRINMILEHVSNEGKKKRFPNDWSREHEKKYQGEELQSYYKHLYQLGWRRVKTSGAGTIWKLQTPI